MAYSNKYDNALNKLKKIKEDFKDFCTKCDDVTEADTRVNLIDRILYEVLDWDRNQIWREPYEKSDRPMYVDYKYLDHDKPLLIIEAKREGKYFSVPENIKSLNIRNILDKKDELSNAISQTREYCDSIGCQFGITTNGYSWIIFRAIIIGENWRDKEAIVFKSLDDIEKHFDRFWSLLNSDHIKKKSLFDAFPDIIQEKDEEFLNELKNDFNYDNYLNDESFYKKISKYNGKELPIARAVFMKEGFIDKEQIFYFASEYLNWAGSSFYKIKLKENISLNCLFISVNKKTAEHIFEEKNDYYLYATVNTENNILKLQNIRLRHRLRSIEYPVNGLTQAYPIESFTMSKDSIITLNVDADIRRIYVVYKTGKYQIIDYYNKAIVEEYAIPLENKEVIDEASISPNGGCIILITSKGLYSIYKWFRIIGDSLQSIDLENLLEDRINNYTFYNEELVFVTFNNSYGFIDVNKQEYIKLSNNKKKWLSLSARYDKCISMEENIIAVTTKSSIIIINTNTYEVLNSIKYSNISNCPKYINSKNLDKLVFVNENEILIKLKNDDSIMKIDIDKKNDYKVKRVELNPCEIMQNPNIIKNTHLIVTISRERYNYSYESKYTLGVINLLYPLFETELARDKHICFFYSQKDGILYSGHTDGSIKIWKLIDKTLLIK